MADFTDIKLMRATDTQGKARGIVTICFVALVHFILWALLPFEFALSVSAIIVVIERYSYEGSSVLAGFAEAVEYASDLTATSTRIGISRIVAKPTGEDQPEPVDWQQIDRALLEADERRGPMGAVFNGTLGDNISFEIFGMLVGLVIVLAAAASGHYFGGSIRGVLAEISVPALR